MEQALNPYVQCPYNTAHQVPKLRLQHHIIRCRKNYEAEDQRICPFNATHITSSKRFAAHLTKCPDRWRLEGHKYNDTHDGSGDLGNPSFYDSVSFSYSWEEDDHSNMLDKRRGRESTWREHLRPSSLQDSVHEVPHNRAKPGALDPLPPDDEDEDFVPPRESKHDASKTRTSDMKLPSNSMNNTPTPPSLKNSIARESESKKIDWLGIGRGRVHKVLLDLNQS